MFWMEKFENNQLSYKNFGIGGPCLSKCALKTASFYPQLPFLPWYAKLHLLRKKIQKSKKIKLLTDERIHFLALSKLI